MTKGKDPVSGTISRDGKLRKRLEPEVRKRLESGDRHAREILLAAGCRKSSLYTSPVRAAHPGGSAPIGKVVDTKPMPRTLPMILQWDESFDVGSDTLTGVNDADYQPPFPLTARLNKLTLKVDRPQLSPEEIKKLEAAMTQKAQAD